jgi:hypothetical protein
LAVTPDKESFLVRFSVRVEGVAMMEDGITKGSQQIS